MEMLDEEELAADYMRNNQNLNMLLFIMETP